MDDNRRNDSPLSALDFGSDVRNERIISDKTLTVSFDVPDEDKNRLHAVAWTDKEITRILEALNGYADVIGFQIEQQDYDDADLKFVKSGTNGSSMIPPGGVFPNPGLGLFSVQELHLDEGRALVPGTLDFNVVVHEIGHGFGLAHPHDKVADSPAMRGVDGQFSTGAYELNQGINTVMSYNYGWPKRPDGWIGTDDFGYPKGPMALDIAVLQRKYGANLEHATGDNTYTLIDTNSSRSQTGYRAIWDAGGVDTIAAELFSSKSVAIDLRPASIEYEPNGGGYVSAVFGIYGGYTIAKGVVIENASGGKGSDHLVGNDVGNGLTGSSGDDIFDGLAGNDEILGGNGSDTIWGGRGQDTLVGGIEADHINGGQGHDILIGGDRTWRTDFDRDTLEGGSGNDTFVLEYRSAWAVEMTAPHWVSWSSITHPEKIISGLQAVSCAKTWNSAQKPTTP